MKIVANMSNGDARIGLQILKLAAREAESKGLKVLSIEEIKKASRCVRKYKLSYLVAKLNEHQRVIYQILKANKSMESGRLYDEYYKIAEEPVVDRVHRNHMERMEELGLVKSKGLGRWKKYDLI